MRKLLPYFAAFVVAAVIGGGMSILSIMAGRPTTIMTYLPGTLFGMLAAVLVVGLQGNRKVVPGSPAQRDAAAAMTPTTDHALLYVYRKSLTAQAVGFDFALDGNPVTQIKSGRFTCCALSPGPHRMTVTFASALTRTAPASVDIAAVAGDIHVFRIDNRIGLLANSIELIPIDRDEARRMLAGLRLVLPEGAAVFS